MNKQLQISLVGNPNTGKTSLFNQLTGLHQKVGNYPGITVDVKKGTCKISDNLTATINDLPGTYSINPTSIDESLVLKELLRNDAQKTDVIITVAAVENLKRNLFLVSQIQDLNIPTVLVINMSDQMEKKGISIDLEHLQNELQIPVVLHSTRSSKSLQKIKDAVITAISAQKTPQKTTTFLNKIDSTYFETLKNIAPEISSYKLWLMVTQNYFSEEITNDAKDKLKEIQGDITLIKRYQHKETIYRYQHINAVLKTCYSIDSAKATHLRAKLDAIFTHKIFGYFIFFGLLLLMFQSVFEWAAAPMDFIDNFFANLSSFSKNKLPQGKLNDLVSDGIIPGIGGVLIFIPQISILFLFIALFEETGYMSRVVFLMDKIMRHFGINGKSIIPLISGTACAIPAVMASRTIKNWKERLITILVVPFTTCSARLPVYSILIALVIPSTKIFGVINLQGLVLLSLYALGFITAIISAFIIDKFLKRKYSKKEVFVIEMPDYKVPSIKNIGFEVFDKTKTFVLDAGKLILAISIVLWFLASHGPSKFNSIEERVINDSQNVHLTESERSQKIASLQLENSYIGILGKKIEPLVTPLGYDWKIGIGLITSFAAREVFVGTLATIYSIGEAADDEATIKERMQKETDLKTGKKRFNIATGISLLLFYAFAMQCMATLAIVKRETKSWKWPIIQLFGMGILAYVSALIAYQILQ